MENAEDEVEESDGADDNGPFAEAPRSGARTLGGKESAAEEGSSEDDDEQEGGLVKHVLEFRPEETCQIGSSGGDEFADMDKAKPWGCYVRYLIPWEDSGGRGNGGANGDEFSSLPPMEGESMYGVSSTFLWWDADSPLLNGCARHSLFLPAALPVVDAICPRVGGGSKGRGIKMELWSKVNEGASGGEGVLVKVANCLLKSEDLDGIAKREMPGMMAEVSAAR